MSDAPNRLAVLFPGQGSQEKGMGRDLAEADPAAMALWKTAEKLSGLPLRAICWEGEEPDMAATRSLQPALTAVTLNLWQAARARLAPAFAAGHSLGEFAALSAAGVLSPEEVLGLVSLRGRLMSEAGGEGAMAAVLKLSEEQVAELVEDTARETGLLVRVANCNSPAQTVVSGEKPAVEALAEKARAAKGRAVMLAVSGAFHTPLMAEPAAELAKVIEKTDFRPAKFPVVMNASGAPESDPARLKARLKEQMTAGVLWTKSLTAMWSGGARRFVELGPKGVLTRLLKANFEGRTEPWTGENLAGAADLARL